MARIGTHRVKLFTLNANPKLAQSISEHTNIPLGDCEVFKFANSEIIVNINETVRGYHCFIVQPVDDPVNENLMELLIMIDALKRASAKNINIIMPYYGYCRQDRKSKSREPITAKLVAELLQTAGATRVISMDLHASQIQGFFDIPIDNFFALPIIAKYLKTKKFNLNETIVVSPDHGGAKRARRLGSALGVPIAIVDKRRPRPNVAEVMSIIGEVKDKVCIIIDDMIDTGGSLVAAAAALKDSGAKEVYAACTHPLLSGDAAKNLQESVLKEVICTDTVNIPDYKQFDKLVQLSVGPLLAQGLINIVENKPLSVLFDL